MWLWTLPAPQGRPQVWKSKALLLIVAVVVCAGVGCESPAEVTATARVRIQATALTKFIYQDRSWFYSQMDFALRNCERISSGRVSRHDGDMYLVIYDSTRELVSNPITTFLSAYQRREVSAIHNDMYQEASGARWVDAKPYCDRLAKLKPGVVRKLNSVNPTPLP